ncbi:chromophore lyase CpcT/CpeT [Engelhardtia mirabilis]|uniref:Putative phycoerythrobilin lyase CpeT n=1 Tax=Engelhardtia mirabilis TaxID=2528011 RepID=A0A518BEI5_9BACT|nr:putative phycoerythrobilin lyase CpeT [Planctomycetes bacterium Pla133]QDU99724.1 putative phycoerythrobilin lyase CpeT [Planctomycetes bacterium Pla86]
MTRRSTSPGARGFALALVLGVAAAATGCAGPGGGSPAVLDKAVELAHWMVGSFDSADQAAQAPDDYLDIHLETVRIWTDRSDGPWLYVEQAAATALDRPYRQRVYHLVRDGAGVRSDVYELPGDPLALAGAWRDPARLAGLGPRDLIRREGCSIWLRRTPTGWVGSTRGQDCASSLGDAVYATSEVTITATSLSSWDRGFDANGEQVWGAAAGGYRFVKRR